MKALQEAWQAHPPSSEDPIHSFVLSWKCLRGKYKEIQDFAKTIEDPIAHLYIKLT